MSFSGAIIFVGLRLGEGVIRMSAPSVVLEIVDGPAAGRIFTFRGQDTFILGRCDSASLSLLNDSHLSRSHLRIEIDPPRCCVQDLDSANGTFVNGERVAERWLENGDTICGGQTLIRVRIEETVDDLFSVTQVIDSPDSMSRTLVIEPPPHVIGPYRLEEQIGVGTMGVVYRAIHQENRTEVAIKLIAASMSSNSVIVKSFLREASVLRQLDHKRIVRFISAGIEKGHLYLMMEYVRAIDLPETLGRMSQSARIRVACGLMRQILDGLSYAHDKGLVHRDIKPRNVLVSHRENGLSARLADFGLAKNFMEAGLSQFSCENEIKGTLSFMAPEQVENSRYATPKSDLFSVGATLYTLISRLPIYELGDTTASIDAILRNGPIPIHQRIPNVPPKLANVLERSLAHDPASRFRNATEMRDALTELAAGRD